MVACERGPWLLFSFSTGCMIIRARVAVTPFLFLYTLNLLECASSEERLNVYEFGSIFPVQIILP